jgi:septum formation protein
MTSQCPEGLIILASGSRTRHHMLQAAGLRFTVVPADLDETALRREMAAEDPPAAPREVALRLAIAKAEQVSAHNADCLVIGSDQVLDLEGEILSKPDGPEGARRSLALLAGRTHELHSAVALARNGKATWDAIDTARLTMRPLSAAFIEDYMRRGGASLCQSVGAYQIEGLGIQLFERVVGDHFTILGLPLMALLGELRSRKVIPT